MKKKFKSFIFPETTKKQIDSMPAEMKLKFYEAVTNYGMYGIEPEGLSEIEKLIWIPMQDLIDNCSSGKGGAPEGNQNAAKKAEEEPAEEKTTETTQNNRNNVDLIKTTETTLINHNHNPNLKDKGNENQNHTHNPKEPADAACVPPYIPDPNKNLDKKLRQDLFYEVTKHNGTTTKDRMVPISKTQYDFDSKEMQELLHAIGPQQEGNDVRAALENFLKVCRSDTWMKSHSWSTFCKHYTDYTPEFFTLERYLNEVPETDDATKKPENIFRQAHKDDPHFSRHAFRDHVNEWLEAGRPDGADYYKLQDEWVRQGPPEECRSLYDAYDDFEPREVENAV